VKYVKNNVQNVSILLIIVPYVLMKETARLFLIVIALQVNMKMMIKTVNIVTTDAQLVKISIITVWNVPMIQEN